MRCWQSWQTPVGWNFGFIFISRTVGAQSEFFFNVWLLNVAGARGGTAQRTLRMNHQWCASRGWQDVPNTLFEIPTLQALERACILFGCNYIPVDERAATCPCEQLQCSESFIYLSSKGNTCIRWFTLYVQWQSTDAHWVKSCENNKGEEMREMQVEVQTLRVLLKLTITNKWGKEVRIK